MNREPIRLTDRGHGPGRSWDYTRSGFRGRLGWWLRCLADRIDHKHATKTMSFSFTFEDYEGIRLRDDGWGCPLAYLGGDAEYERAHSESDTAEHHRRRDAETREILGQHGVDLDDILRRRNIT